MMNFSENFSLSSEREFIINSYLTKIIKGNILLKIFFNIEVRITILLLYHHWQYDIRFFLIYPPYKNPQKLRKCEKYWNLLSKYNTI